MHFFVKSVTSIAFLMVTLVRAATFHIISASGEPISYCKLCIIPQDSCYFSDSSGIIAFHFSDSSDYSINLSASAYCDTLISLSKTVLTENSITIVLKEKEPGYQLPKMVVSASPINNKSLPALSSTKFTSYDIMTSAGAANDISRYIGTLPSTVSGIGKGYDNTLYVRGGRPSEVIFLVDGIEMENINHFSTADGSGGPIGFINTDFVDSVRFFAENIPVSYPPRISSVVDITMKNGPNDRFQLAPGVENTGGMYSMQGPFWGSSRSYVLAGRYVDFTPIRSVIAGKGIPKLGDVYGKFGMLKNDNLELSTTGIFSFNWYRYAYPITVMSDAIQPQMFSNVDNQIQRIFQGGAGISLRYSSERSAHEIHVSASFRDGSDSDSLASFTNQFFAQKYANNPITKEIDNRIRYTLSTKSTSSVSEKSSVSYGIHAQTVSYDFASSNESQNSGTCIECLENKPVTVQWTQKPLENSLRLDDQEYGAFASFDLSNERFKGSLGLRADYFKMLDNLAFSPRFSAAYDVYYIGTITGGFGLYRQLPSDMPSLTYQYLAQYYALTNDSLKAIETRLLHQMQPLRCWETSIGYDKTFLKSFDAKCGLYYKWYDREYPYSTPYAQDLFYVDSTGKIVLPSQNSNRKAYGVELSLQHNHSRRFFYSLSGSVFDFKDKFSDGSWHDDWVNVGYTFSASGGFQFLDNHQFSLSVQGTGGRPYSPEIIVTDCIGRKSAQYSPNEGFNSQRLDKIITTNVRYCFTTHYRNWRVESFIEILNLFNNLPTLDYEFDGAALQPVKPFGITPIIGCKVEL